MVWYCAFCGKYHTALIRRYGVNGWRKRGLPSGKDNVCGKGVVFIALLKNTLGS